MSKLKQSLIAISIVMILFVCLGGVKYMQISAAIAASKNAGPPPPTVSTSVVSEIQWVDSFKTFGVIDTKKGATLRAESGGKIIAINFPSGSELSEGDVIAEIEADVEKAELEGALSQLKLAEVNLSRQRSLRKKNANSKSQLDSAEAELAFRSAEVKRLKALIERKTIRAPYAGRLGVIKVDLGEVLAVGDEIVDLFSNEDLVVDFALPQIQLGKFKNGQKVNIFLDDEVVGEGELTAIGSRVSTLSGNIDLQAEIKEVGSKSLIAGMYVDVEIIFSDTESKLAIPTSSVKFAPYGASVFILGEQNKQGQFLMVSKSIKTGDQKGDYVEIISGLNKGDKVVNAGSFRLRPGQFAYVNDDIKPKTELSPKPSNS